MCYFNIFLTFKILNDVERDGTLKFLLKFAVDFLRYQDAVRGLSENIAISVMEFVRESRASLKASNIVPLMFLIILGWEHLN